MIPIAGNFILGTGATLEPRYTRLKTSPIKEYDAQEGVLVEINGKKDSNSVKQKAAITFECRREKTKAEDAERRLRQSDDEEEGGDDKKGEDDDDKKKGRLGEAMDDVDDGKGGTIKFLSRGPVGEFEVLRIKWLTKYACEDAQPEQSSHWGFFTWIFVM